MQLARQPLVALGMMLHVHLLQLCGPSSPHLATTGFFFTALGTTGCTTVAGISTLSMGGGMFQVVNKRLVKSI